MSWLTNPRIEKKAKKIYQSAFFSSNVELSEYNEKALKQIRNCIRIGAALPEHFYRNKSKRPKDELLEKSGILHLHLGDSTSNQLLYLIQDYVVYLEVNDHEHFETNPVGKNLLQTHRNEIQRISDQHKAQADQKKAAKNAEYASKMRATLFPEKPTNESIMRSWMRHVAKLFG